MDRYIVLALFFLSLNGDHNQATATCSEPGSPFSITEMSGTIKSPGYPDSYEANENCTWEIKPPYRPDSAKIAIVTIVNIDMELDGRIIPNSCHNVANFVRIDTATACGKEGPTCIAYILNTPDIRCKLKAELHYPNCHSLGYSGWPLNIHFETKSAASKPGFHIDYEFMDCSMNGVLLNLLPKKNVTDQNETERPTEPIEINTTPDRSTTHSKGRGEPDVSGSGSPTSTAMITIIVVLLFVLLIIIVGLILTRKHIRKWMTCHKTNFHQGTRKQSVPYSEKYIMPPNTATTMVGYEAPNKRDSPPFMAPYSPPVDNNNKEDGSTALNGPSTISKKVYDRLE